MSELSEFKVILVGEIRVGKTSLIVRFAENKFYENPKSTIKVDIKTVYLDVNRKECLMHIFDTGGQETFYSLGTSFFRGADGVIFVYDETRPETFDKISEWFRCIQNHCGDGIVKLLAGNKTDDKEKKRVLNSRVKSFAEEQNVEVFKTSAKSDTNVKEVFLRLTELIAQSKKISQAGTVPMIKVLESPRNLLKAMDESKESYVKERRSKFVAEHSKHLRGIRLCPPSELEPPASKPMGNPSSSGCPCSLF